MYIQPQYPGAQGGMVIIQPSGAIATVPQGYPLAGQQPVYFPQQVSIQIKNFIIVILESLSGFVIKLK